MKRIILPLFTFIIHCNLYNSIVTEKIEIKNSFASKDEAVIKLLQAISDNDWEKVKKYSFSREEYIAIYHPALKDYPYIASKMKAEDAWPIIELKYRVGADKLRQRLTGKKISSVKYLYRKGEVEYRKHGNLIVWLPDAVQITFVDGSTEIVEQIGSIVENHGQFKVGLLKSG